MQRVHHFGSIGGETKLQLQEILLPEDTLKPAL